MVEKAMLLWASYFVDFMYIVAWFNVAQISHIFLLQKRIDK